MHARVCVYTCVFECVCGGMCMCVSVCVHYVCACLWGASCMCVHVPVCTSRDTEDELKCSLAGSGWEQRRQMAENPGLRVRSLFCITRALECSWVLCHPSSDQRRNHLGMFYSHSGEPAREGFFTDYLPSFCPRKSSWRRSVMGQPPPALLHSVTSEPSAPKKQCG